MTDHLFLPVDRPFVELQCAGERTEMKQAILSVKKFPNFSQPHLTLTVVCVCVHACVRVLCACVRACVCAYSLHRSSFPTRTGGPQESPLLLPLGGEGP